MTCVASSGSSVSAMAVGTLDFGAEDGDHAPCRCRLASGSQEAIHRGMRHVCSLYVLTGQGRIALQAAEVRVSREHVQTVEAHAIPQAPQCTRVAESVRCARQHGRCRTRTAGQLQSHKPAASAAAIFQTNRYISMRCHLPKGL